MANEIGNNFETVEVRCAMLIALIMFFLGILKNWFYDGGYVFDSELNILMFIRIFLFRRVLMKEMSFLAKDCRII